MKAKYGINVTKWCKLHEREVCGQIESALPAGELQFILSEHEKKLTWLMHERLVHLIVMITIGIVMLFSVGLILLAPDSLPASLPLFVISFVLTCFYVKHYFFLENTVQRWYAIDEEITAKLKDLQPPASFRY